MLFLTHLGDACTAWPAGNTPGGVAALPKGLLPGPMPALVGVPSPCCCHVWGLPSSLTVLQAVQGLRETLGLVRAEVSSATREGLQQSCTGRQEEVERETVRIVAVCSALFMRALW
jgi:hypothetical protein